MLLSKGRPPTRFVQHGRRFPVEVPPLGVSVPLKSSKVEGESKSKAESRKEQVQPGVYHHLQPFLTLSTYLGLMPLTSTIGSSRRSEIVFQWLSVPTFLTVTLMSGMAAMGVAASNYYLTTPAPKWGIEAIAVHPRKMIFYLVTPSVLLLSLRLARVLPDVVREWDDAVQVLRKPTYMKQWPIHMSRSHVAFVSGIFAALALVEHVLHDVSLGSCSMDDDEGNDDNGFLQCYYQGTPFVSTYLDYSEPLAVAIVIVEKFAMLAWNFPSLLVILFSLSLNANFRVISKHVQKRVSVNANAFNNVTAWKEIREDHLVLCRLLRLLDNAISPLTLMTFFINMYWNCVQAYSSLRPKARIGMEIVYFWTSFLLLTVRLGGVSLAGTQLYEQANKPLKYLFYCSPTSYSEEVVRFQTHITGQSLGFTGMKFFVVNRQLLLTIISLILTYELILLDSK